MHVDQFLLNNSAENWLGNLAIPASVSQYEVKRQQSSASKVVALSKSALYSLSSPQQSTCHFGPKDQYLIMSSKDSGVKHTSSEAALD